MSFIVIFLRKSKKYVLFLFFLEVFPDVFFEN